MSSLREQRPPKNVTRIFIQEFIYSHCGMWASGRQLILTKATWESRDHRCLVTIMEGCLNKEGLNWCIAESGHRDYYYFWKKTQKFLIPLLYGKNQHMKVTATNGMYLGNVILKGHCLWLTLVSPGNSGKHLKDSSLMIIKGENITLLLGIW